MFSSIKRKGKWSIPISLENYGVESNIKLLMKFVQQTENITRNEIFNWDIRFIYISY